METRMLTGRRHAMTLLTLLEKHALHLIFLRILLMHHGRYNELLGLAMSRAAMKRTHCVAMLDNNNEIVCCCLVVDVHTFFRAAYRNLVVLSAY